MHDREVETSPEAPPDNRAARILDPTASADRRQERRYLDGGQNYGEADQEDELDPRPPAKAGAASELPSRRIGSHGLVAPLIDGLPREGSDIGVVGTDEIT